MANPNNPEPAGMYRRASDQFIALSLLGNAIIVMASFIAIWSQISGALIASERRSTILETKVDSILEQNKVYTVRQDKLEERVLELEKEASAK
jgi:hypothetical protein